MKQQLEKLILVYLLLFLFSNCTKEVEIDIPVEPSKLVVNSLFSTDNKIQLYLAESNYIFDAAAPPITNAFVLLKENSKIIDTLKHQNSGIYSSEIQTVGNQKYDISVSVNGFPNVYATDSLPQKVSILSSKRTDNVDTDEYGSSYSQLRINFQDIKGKKNYYEVFLSYKYNDIWFDIIDNDTTVLSKDTLKGIAMINSNDPVIQTEIEGETHSFFFTDDLIDGTNYTLTIDYKTMLSQHINEDYILYVHFNSVSKNYYNYRKKLYLYRKSNPDIWNNSGEVVYMYSNITNGYGIFAGYCSDIDTLKQ